MKEKPKPNQLPNNIDPTSIDFSPSFLLYIAELRENKIEYLNFLITIQRLLIKEASKNNWTKEYLETLNNNLLVLQQLIFNA